MWKCTVSQKQQQQQQNKIKTLNSNTYYRWEMKFIPISMDYCLLSFDAFKFSLGIRLHEGSSPNFNFSIVNHKLDDEIVKFTTQITWIPIFTTFLTLVLLVLLDIAFEIDMSC